MGNVMAEIYADIRRAVHAVAWHWPSVDAEDVVQAVAERLLKEPKTRAYIASQTVGKRINALKRLAVTHNSDEVSEYEAFNAEDTYTVSEIRYLLRHGVLTEETWELPGESENPFRDACNVRGPSSAIIEGQKFYILDVFDFRDLFRAFAKSQPTHAERVFRHYVTSEEVDRHDLRNAITALTQSINRKMVATRSKARQDAAFSV